MKQCSKCNEFRLPADFSKNKNAKDGLNAWCKPCNKAHRKQSYDNDREKHLTRSKAWRDENVEYNRERNKKWLQENEDRRKAYKKQYRKENRDSINAYKREQLRRNLKDPLFRLEVNLRKRLRKAVHRIKDSIFIESYTQKSRELVGCSLEFLKTYLECKFTEGMSWDNYGEWHIDHIRPVCSFDLSQDMEIKECFHYTNLQPLWAEDNVKKGANVQNS